MMPTPADRSSRFVLPPDSPLLGNLAALWCADPELAMALEAELDNPGYETEPTRSPAPTATVTTGDGRKIYLHSRYQPLQEAQRLVSGDAFVGSGLYAIYGLGLGYHVQALYERAGDAAILAVFEPDLRMIRTALGVIDYAEMIRSGRVIFITHADRGEMLRRLSPHQHLVTLGMELVAHPPSLQAQPAFHARMQTWMTEYADYCKTNLRTLLLNGRRTAENLARNIGWYAAAGDVRRLRDRHAGRPAIIVSAGPSLRKNRHLLAQAKGRAVIIAVQTTLRPLLEMGVEPDYVTSLDYHDICQQFFERLPGGLKTELVAEPKACAAIFGMYPGPVTLLGSDFCEKLLWEHRPQKERFRAGATVAHLAFYLAEYAGCDPVVFVGQDLGFSDGLSYTPGTTYEEVWRPELGRFCTMEMKQWEHIARERPILRKLEGWDGHPMYTEERLFTYLQQFERDFSQSTRRIIDATEGGVKKRGAEAMTLSQVLQRYCAAELPASACDAPLLHWERLGEVRACLQTRLEEAGRMGEIGRRTLPLLEEVRDSLDDAMRVNRAIAQIDLLRSEMMQLNHCYELATQLSQQTELSRFRKDYAIAASRAEGTEKQRRQVERDIENVTAIIAAAGDLERLLEQVLGELEAQAGRCEVGSDARTDGQGVLEGSES